MSQKYSSQNIKVLKGLEAVRVRPGMYIGNTDDGSGLHHMIYEVTDNSVDEALAGHCDTIHITVHADGSASVEDNGRGIPVDMHEEGASAAQVIMTQLHAGGKFDQDTYKISGGLHGVGVSVVNALSDWLELLIIRDGKLHFMRFRKGQPEKALKEITFDEYKSLGEHAPEVIERLKTRKSGTYIRFVPDNSIFSTCEFSAKTLSTRYNELAFLNPKLTFYLKDDKTGQEYKFYDEGGVKNFVLMNAKNKTLLFDTPFSCNFEKDGIFVNLAIVWATNAYDDNTLCYTNNIPQKEGGTHLQGFRTGLTKVMQKFMPEQKLKGMTCSGEDIREGMFAVLSAKVPNPRFASQTKEKLVSTEVRPIVEHAIQETLSRWLEENPNITKQIVERILEAIRAREAAKKARDLTRKTKGHDSNLSIAGKLADCAQKNPAVRELFIVEGQSAGGTAKMARNRDNQAVLALQGKILNVEKALLNKILQYEAIRVLITALGTGVSEDCNPEDCKYHKIIIMTDADVDGSHIRTLLLTFLLRYMYPLIEAGYVYISRPPLYAIKSKKHNTIYLNNDEQLEEYIIANTCKALTITRQAHTLDDPAKEAFYHLAFKVKAELEQFQDLTEAFVKSGTITKLSQSTAKDDLLTYLNKHYQNCSIEIDNGIWNITYIKYAKQINYKLNIKPFSHEVQQFLEDWQPVQVKVHTKIYSIENILEFNALIDKLKSDLFEISRFKGLGEMNPKELRDTGIKPETRIIEQVSISDFDATDHMTKLLMGDEVAPRRDFIERNALNAVVDL